MKAFLFLLVASVSAVAWAQTNMPLPTPPKIAAGEKTVIKAKTGYFDNITHRLVYIGEVRVNNPRIKLECERLTVNVPEDGQSISRLLAETNVVIDFVDEKQKQTYHVTAANALYEFNVVNSVTNSTVTFTGLPGRKPRVVTAQGVIRSEPLVWDRVASKFNFFDYEMELESAAVGTNGSPMGNFLK